jgi:hypothetical protein
MLPTSNGDRYEPAAADFIATCHEAPVIGVLPYGQPRTRCPPDFEYLGVWARVGTYPLEKVEDQRFNGVGHRALWEVAGGSHIATPCGASKEDTPRSVVTELYQIGTLSSLHGAVTRALWSLPSLSRGDSPAVAPSPLAREFREHPKEGCSRKRALGVPETPPLKVAARLKCSPATPRTQTAGPRAGCLMIRRMPDVRVEDLTRHAGASTGSVGAGHDVGRLQSAGGPWDVPQQSSNVAER